MKLKRFLTYSQSSLWRSAHDCGVGRKHSNRHSVDDQTRRYIKALPEGVSRGLLSPEALRTVVDYDVRAPLKLKETVPVERLMNLKFVEEVRKELEGKRSQ